LETSLVVRQRKTRVAFRQFREPRSETGPSYALNFKLMKLITAKVEAAGEKN